MNMNMVAQAEPRAFVIVVCLQKCCRLQACRAVAAGSGQADRAGERRHKRVLQSKQMRLKINSVTQ